MERTTGPSLQDICRGLVKLRIELTEIIVDRRSTEHADAASLLLLVLEPLRLDDDTEALNEEDATEDGQQQFLMDDDGTHTDDTSNGKRAGVAHENLCGESVVPQETNHGSHESTEENHQFLRVRNIHDIEIV